MKVIKSHWIPLRGFTAINLFGIVFVRTDADTRPMSRTRYERMLRHEYIHTQQMRELLYLPFYLWYVVEWLVRLMIYRDAYRAYQSISFEREAYRHQDDRHYSSRRPWYAFVRYL